MQKFKLHSSAVLAAILLLCAVASRAQKSVQQIATSVSQIINTDTVARSYNININKEKILLPDGDYTAWWSGYQMEIEVAENKSVIIKDLLQGIRGINVKTNIVVKNGYISVVSKQ